MARSALKLWKCPTCKRTFAKKNQWHSCLARSAGDHFRGKPPRLKETFELLLTHMREFGPLRVDAVKSSINFASKYHFGGASVTSDHLRVGFLSDKIIKDRRIVRVERLGPNKVGHSVVLRSVDDVDDELVNWLRKAYTMQS